MASTTDKDGSEEPTTPSPSVTKAVTIDLEPEQISPNLTPQPSPRTHRASLSGKKMTRRPIPSTASSTTSISRQLSSLKLDHWQGDSSASSSFEDPSALFAQVSSWLQEQRTRKSRPIDSGYERDDETYDDPQRSRSNSQTSEDALALNKLERILASHTASASKRASLSAAPPGSSRTPFATLRKSSMARKLKPNSLSLGNESQTDEDLVVPDVEANLDNSKTDLLLRDGSIVTPKQKECWNEFKQEIVRLTHTLKIKRWRLVSIENGAKIHVEKLSSALTNAVYVVSPPDKLFESAEDSGGGGGNPTKKPPPKLLLRIYGSQTEYLVDRERELSILRRLAKKNIGARMLGTFSNGRFEQFLNARTLTAEDLRVPETSRQIAKRMRELHDGVSLLAEERERGPSVWADWDRWVERAEPVGVWLDKQILSGEGGRNLPDGGRPWIGRGFVCGTEWGVFKRTVDRYRKMVLERHGGKKGIRDELVFAHNDTQYGNLLRLQPSGESPLLHPANEHKQLVVIDFEYASANLPGYEFANHFTEWCYNYHDPARSWVVNTAHYPTPEEQRRFVRAYLQHQPSTTTITTATVSGTPAEATTPRSSAKANPVEAFMLDSRAPPGEKADYPAEERARNDVLEEEVTRLVEDARLWRGMCSARWALWGLVQAKLPGMEQPVKRGESRADRLLGKVRALQRKGRERDQQQPQGKAGAEEAEDEAGEEEKKEGEGDAADDDYDHLAYTQDRALLFWGDALQLGVVKEDELPAELRKKAKVLKC